LVGVGIGAGTIVAPSWNIEGPQFDVLYPHGLQRSPCPHPNSRQPLAVPIVASTRATNSILFMIRTSQKNTSSHIAFRDGVANGFQSLATLQRPSGCANQTIFSHATFSQAKPREATNDGSLQARFCS
jgi:hypothetical protein